MGLKAAWNALVGRSIPAPAASRVVREAAPADEMAPLLDVPDYSEIVAAVNAHHAEITQLRLEWAETLDKFTAWANRQAARDRVRMKASMREMEGNEDDNATPPQPNGSQPMLPFGNMESAGIPATPNGNYRHPKADLYARIRRS